MHTDSTHPIQPDASTCLNPVTFDYKNPDYDAVYVARMARLNGSRMSATESGASKPTTSQRSSALARWGPTADGQCRQIGP
jgi:hypothetical protein